MASQSFWRDLVCELVEGSLRSHRQCLRSTECRRSLNLTRKENKAKLGGWEAATHIFPPQNVEGPYNLHACYRRPSHPPSNARLCSSHLYICSCTETNSRCEAKKASVHDEALLCTSRIAGRRIPPVFSCLVSEKRMRSWCATQRWSVARVIGREGGANKVCWVICEGVPFCVAIDHMREAESSAYEHQHEHMVDVNSQDKSKLTTPSQH